MTTSREKFEAWMQTPAKKPELWIDGAAAAEIAWEGWQAGRESMRIEALGKCEVICRPLANEYGNAYNQAAIDCEKAIRGIEP